MKENRKEAEFKKENSVICLKGFIAEIPSTKAGEKGLLTSLEFSKRCNYKKLEQYQKSLKKKEVLVHKKCPRDFTDIKRSLQYSDVTTSKPKKSKIQYETIFMENVLLFMFQRSRCDDKHPKRKQIFNITLISIRNQILEHCRNRLMNGQTL